MLASLSKIQSQTLQKILSLSLSVEKSHAEGQSLSEENAKRLGEISILLRSFANEKEVSLKKLSEIPEHFKFNNKKAEDLSHFVNLMIPVERLLDRQLKDSDFLQDFVVNTEDTLTKKEAQRPLYFILDNLRSAFNVGSIFRLADSVGATEIALCGYTPKPEQDSVKKTSMSADQFISYRCFEKAESAVKHYQEMGIQVLALETAESATDIYADHLKGPVAFLLGNERFGLDYRLLKQVNNTRKIPMYGIKNSLNVGQAAAIAAFEWSRQNP